MAAVEQEDHSCCLFRCRLLCEFPNHLPVHLGLELILRYSIHADGYSNQYYADTMIGWDQNKPVGNLRSEKLVVICLRYYRCNCRHSMLIKAFIQMIKSGDRHRFVAE